MICYKTAVSRNDIFYFNFADDRLQPMQDTVLNDIVTEYWRQYPDSRDHGCYLFLDEVQGMRQLAGILPAHSRT